MSKVEESLVGPGLPVHSVQVFRAVNNPDLFLGFARYGNCCEVATGTGSSFEEAKLKAIMEAYERKASTSPSRPVIRGSVNSLERRGEICLNLSDYAPLSEAQSARYRLNIPVPNRKIHWVRGSRWNGESVLVPMDLVFYCYPSKDNLYYANSSGVAAHENATRAVELALTELIERDAIMQNWFKKEAPLRIEPSQIGPDVKARADYWDSIGRKLTLSQLPSSYGTVILATISGEEWPAFVSGAAATISDNVEATVKKAISEAEGNFEAYSSETFYLPNPELCFTPEQHGLLYCDPDRLDKVKFLLGDQRGSAPEVKTHELRFLLEELDGVIVWLTSPSSNYVVVRVLSPKLIPISFGYDFAHYHHKVLWENCELNDFSKEEIAFPHYFP